MRPNALIGLMLDPILRLVLIVGALQLGLGLDGVLWAFVVIPYITCLLALLWLFVLARGPQVAPRSERRQILRFASVAWVATFTTQGLLWLDLLLLPAYISAAELAIYSVATSVVVLATFAMSPISQSLAPRIADLTRRKELRRLAIAYQAAASWMLRFSLPFFAIILIFPRPLLGLFGAGYGAGAAVTVILALGKLSDVATGPCGTMLNQAGLNKLALIDNVVILILNVSLNLILRSLNRHPWRRSRGPSRCRRQCRPGHPGPPASCRRGRSTRARPSRSPLRGRSSPRSSCGR
jgi:O-antigen/teichoic acid export membrane protein